MAQYRTNISNRDGMCIFTGFTGQACHIIPFARGTGVSCFAFYSIENANPTNQNMSILVHQRSITPAINDINDKRNGFLCQSDLHRLFDQRQVAVLVVRHLLLFTLLTINGVLHRPLMTYYDAKIFPGPLVQASCRTCAHPRRDCPTPFSTSTSPFPKMPSWSTLSAL